MIIPFFQDYIQVAGIIDQVEADLILNGGVNFIGFPLRLPVNKEDITESETKNIISKLSPPKYGVVISYCSSKNETIDLCEKTGSNIIQLHGPIDSSELAKLKSMRSELIIIKSLVITNTNTEALINSLSILDTFVDAYITDTFDPLTGASGATGKTHDWEISKRIISSTTRPVILAGGLRPDNVYTAIKEVKPAGVDVHTGIEGLSGRKDKDLLDKFVREAKKAFKENKNDK